jgi:hypothetical protein
VIPSFRHFKGLLAASTSLVRQRTPWYTLVWTFLQENSMSTTRSYATQAATSQWLADNQELLQSEGVNPGWWGEYSPSDAIRIALQTPTSDQLSELQAAANQLLSPPPTVTTATYLTVAAAVMNTQVPSPGLIVVYPNLLGPGEAANGYNDTKPLSGADQIKYTLSNSATLYQQLFL